MIGVAKHLDLVCATWIHHIITRVQQTKVPTWRLLLNIMHYLPVQLCGSLVRAVPINASTLLHKYLHKEITKTVQMQACHLVLF